METFLQNTLFSFLLEVARTLRGYSILLPQIEINGKNCEFFKQFTRLLKMFKKSGKKMLKAFKLFPVEKQPWKFPKSSCVDGLHTSHGNFHRQNDPKEYFLYGIFHAAENFRKIILPSPL